MNFRGPLAAALAAVLLGAIHRPAPLAVYSAPAGTRPAGASSANSTDAVLPDGRIAAPVGQTILVGTNPLGVALSPNGRYAIVSNDQQNPLAPSALPAQYQNLVPGYSLAVVDTRTMRVVSVYRAPNVTFFVGVAAVADPVDRSRTLVLASDGANNTVLCFDLGADGSLTPESQNIPVAGFPASISVALDGRVAYVTGNLAGTVSTIDLATRRVLHTANVGYYPFDVAASKTNAYVTNGGFSHYSALSQPSDAPQFANPTSDPDKASSLSAIALDTAGDFASSDATTVRMDPTPDGTALVGGARPGSIVVRRDGAYAYVAMQNVDRVATVSLRGEPRVVAGLDLRLFVNAPYGTQPSAEALSRDGKRLYVALAGLNAVAVLDARNPTQLHRLGLIPTAWSPSALALSPDGRYLYVVDAKGVDGWGCLQRIDMKTLPLIKVTLSALRYNRSVAAARANAVVPPLRSKARSNVIDRVVYLSVGTASFDAMLGDLQHGNDDAALATYGSSVTPNLHALARTYALADNFYANDLNVDTNAQFALGGAATLYTQHMLAVNSGRAPLDAHGEDPENYPRAGYLFNELARSGLSFRDYGAMLNLSGYVPDIPVSSRNRRPPSPLGGKYTLDVPALAALADHVDADYPGWNPAVDDMARAQAFGRDVSALVAAGTEPSFSYIWLPTVPGEAGVADADRALGAIVDVISHTPHWSSTAIFVVPQGTAGSRDHVNVARSYALVISPLAKPGYVGHRHLSVASVVKTEEEILGLAPLALPDLLATDMADFFGNVPYPSTYHAIP